MTWNMFSLELKRGAIVYRQRPIGVVGPDPDGTGALKYRAQRTSYNALDQVTVVERGSDNEG